jgi:putative hydrolase of the HAD superfamily
MTQVVLFDLGGVLFGAGGSVETFQRWLGVDSADAVWQMWLGSPWIRRFESGRCDSTEFAEGLIRDHELAVEVPALLSAFRGWTTGLLPGAAELVDRVRPDLIPSCLSNTNEVHWRDWSADVARLFKVHFLSFRMGRLKPDVETYRYVAEQLGVPAASILFLDDNQVNVDGANRAGLDAHRVVGVDAAADLLHGRDLLLPRESEQ